MQVELLFHGYDLKFQREGMTLSRWILKSPQYPHSE